MSIVALLIAVGSQQAGEVRREQFLIVGQPIRFEQPIAPAVHQYQGCLHGDLKGRRLVPTRLDAIFEGALKKCAKKRADAILAADELLRNAGWSDPAKRRASIERTFSEIDADHRRHGRRLKAQLERELTPRTTERG